MKKLLAKFKRRKVLLPLVAGVVLIAAVGGFFIWKALQNNSTNSVVRSHVCSDDLIRRASESIDKNELENLRNIESEVRGIKKYDQDQNCLFILLRYRLIIADTKTATTYYSSFKKVYQDDGYSKAFTTLTYSAEEFDNLLKFVDEKKVESAIETMERQNESRIQEEYLKKRGQQ